MKNEVIKFWVILRIDPISFEHTQRVKEYVSFNEPEEKVLEYASLKYDLPTSMPEPYGDFVRVEEKSFVLTKINDEELQKLRELREMEKQVEKKKKEISDS